MHLTCMRAVERLHTEVQAGVERRRKSCAMDGMSVLCGEKFITVR